jgi:hypothetical protein
VEKMLQGFIISIGMLFFSLYTSEESLSRDAQELTVDVSMKYIESKYQNLKNILEQEDDGVTVLKALQCKCDDIKYKFSKEHKKILKRHKVLIKKSYGCFNVKKRYTVCHLVKNYLITRCLNEYAIQDEEGGILRTMDSTDYSQVQSSIEDERVV